MNTVTYKIPLSDWRRGILRDDIQLKVHLHGTPGRFTAPASWRANQHRLTDHLFYYVLRGAMHYQVESTKGVAKRGDMLWCSNNVNFSAHRNGDTPLEFLRFRLHVSNEFGDMSLKEEFVHQTAPASVCQWYEHIIYAAEHTTPTCKIQGLLLCLLADIQQTNDCPANTTFHLNESQIQALEHKVSQSDAFPITVNDLARTVGLSPDYFTRCFSGSMNIPPRKWLVQQRIRTACAHLTESDARISEIATDLGYRDVYHFSRQFKEVMGTPPSTFRQGKTPYRTG